MWGQKRGDFFKKKKKKTPPPPPPKSEWFLSYLIRESLIFLQINKKLLIINSRAAVCRPLSFFIFWFCRKKEVKEQIKW